jgi:hypothetical protein
METFTALKDFVDDPDYEKKREKALRELRAATIDEPLRDLIAGFVQLPYCFTLQSCYGHFVYDGRSDQKNLAPLPDEPYAGMVEYRIAYLALCIEHSREGLDLFRDLEAVTEIDPPYIQFGCAEWFWRRQVNSYALQVEPERHRNKDAVFVSMVEARRIEKVRNAFFARIGELIVKRLNG